MTTQSYEVLDEALSMLAPYGPEFGPHGLSNHGPMASEALCAMGRHDAVLRWVEHYRTRLDQRPSHQSRIDDANWRDALGKLNRVQDWSEFFKNQLADAPAPLVLDAWVARLAPGISAAAFHGVIRVGHAMRSLAERETPARRIELADALGYWAASYQTLPGRNDHAGGSARPSEIIAKLALVPPEMREGKTPTISSGLDQLAHFAPFLDVVAKVDVSGNSDAFISDLTETFAYVYLANGRGILGAITFIHCVTGPVAVRNLAPHLSAATLQSALRYAWQAATAIYVRYGIRPRPRSERVASISDRDELIDRAIATRDEHAIKFAEACLRENRLNPNPAYLAAAEHSAKTLRG
ncbi:MAG: questin oxidase family protein [Candidatus Binataceae bacterium]